jgi:hypothetical protein
VFRFEPRIGKICHIGSNVFIPPLKLSGQVIIKDAQATFYKDFAQLHHPEVYLAFN